MVKHIRWIFGIGVVAIVGWLGVTGASFAAEPINHLSSETCKTCHTEIFKQWKGSMHANSTAFNDPIHATFYRSEVGDPGQEGAVHKKSNSYPICLGCHAPNAARDKKTKLDAVAAYNEGVNCIACHTLKKYKGIQAPNGKLQLGISSYELSDTVQGPGRYSNRKLAALTASGDIFGGGDSDAKPNPHLGEPVTMDGKEIPAIPMESNPKQLKTSDACMGCHDQRNNPHGVPLCQTGNEYSMSNSQVNCLACHMPVSGGVADHSMGGGHDLGILQRAVVFDVSSEKKGDVLVTSVLLKNQQPHSLPTGAPFRNIYMVLTAYDSEGNAVWRNAEGHPAESDPQAYLVYELADNEGKPAGPPVATRLGKDARLKPHEERTLVYEIPAKGVVLVRGELYYSLLWPELVKKFSHLPEDLTAAKLIATSEVSL